MMQDKHFLYPESLGAQDVVDKIRSILCRARANGEVWEDDRMEWHNYINRACFEWGTNPAWVLVSLQRERSLFGQPADARDFQFAQGYVGKDGPGTVNPRWNGLPVQVFLAARGTAWLAGRAPHYAFGWRQGIYPKVPRWRQGSDNEVTLYGGDNKPAGKHKCASMAEFVQLSYTPHLEVLGVNQTILERWAPEFL